MQTETTKAAGWVARHARMLQRALYFCEVSGCRKPRSAAKYQDARASLRYLLAGKCAVAFNTFGHVCQRAKGHAGPHYTESAAAVSA